MGKNEDSDRQAAVIALQALVHLASRYRGLSAVTFARRTGSCR
jgi:hypothetical protein